MEYYYEYDGEIIDAIKAFYDYRETDFLPALHYLMRLVADEAFKEELQHQIDETCKNELICPHCFSPLSCKDHEEYRGECRGEKAYETVYDYYCENCGGMKNEN